MVRHQPGSSFFHFKWISVSRGDWKKSFGDLTDLSPLAAGTTYCVKGSRFSELQRISERASATLHITYFTYL